MMLKLENIATFDQFIGAAAQTYKNRTAIKIRPRFRTVSWTYSDLFGHSALVARLLEREGIRKEDKVLLWAPNSHLWVASFFGIQLKGAVAVPISFQNTADFVKKIIGQTGAKLIIKSSRLPSPHLKGIKTILMENIADIAISENFGANFSPSFKRVRNYENDTAEIIYTSGTTGFPKGVVLSHNNILSNVKASLKAVSLSQNDRFLSLLPLSHMFEQVGGLLVPLSAGAQITYATSLSSIALRKNFVDSKITKMAAVPEFLKLAVKRIESEVEKRGKGGKWLFDALANVSLKIPSMQMRRLLFRGVIKRFGGHLHTIVSGGAPLDAEVGRKLEAFGIYVLQGYGTTEASPVITANRYEDRKIASVGRPLEGVEVKISEKGEVLVKGPNVTQGYFKNLQKTRESFVNGWYRTGDIGYFGKDGHLYVKGRKEYVIITEGGENVYPEDIELELNKIPGVKDSAVVGFKRNDRLNDRLEIHAVLLLLAEGIKAIKKPGEVILKVNSKLAAYQQIQGCTVWPFDDFPRTVTKKVRKDEVLAYLEHLHGKEGKREDSVLTEARITEEERRFYAILSEISGLNVDEITDGKRLGTDLKLDSLARVELVSWVEDEFGVALDEAGIMSNTTVAELKKEVEGKTQKAKAEKYELQEWPLSATIALLRGIAQKLILNPVVDFYAHVKAENLENLKGIKLPVMLFSNHLSAVDGAVILCTLPKNIRKKLAIPNATDAPPFEPKEFRKFAGLLKFLVNIYPFARAGQVRSSLDYTGRLLDRGFSILVFPEGRVSVTGKMRQFKEGTGFLAVEMRVPVIPIKLTGVNYIYPPGRKFPKLPNRHKATVKFGKPMTFPATHSYIDATKEIENVLRSL